MLEGLFSRLGSQFREGGIVHVKFVVAAGPVFAAKSTRPGSSHRKFTLVKNGGTGLLRLTLAGGAREIALLGPPIYVNVAAPTDVTAHLWINPVAAIAETTGILDFVAISSDGTEAAADPVATDEIHFSLYVAK
jgi:hypothetical protein